MRIIFAGTPDFAVAPLEALISQPEHEIVAVYTQPDRPAGRGKKLMASPVKQIALAQGLPIHQPESLKHEATTIGELNADVMVVVAYGMLLPPSILSLPRYGCINIHASLLPRWRGAAPIQRAIQAGDKETGVAIMQMAAGLDTGPVFEMLATPINNSDSSATLHDRLSQLGAKGIVSTLKALEQNPELEAKEQHDELATYAHKIKKSEALLDWSMDCISLHNQVRAFVPWPVCETYHGETRIRTWVCEPDTQNNSNHPPGTIIAIDDAIHVACGSGSLRLLRLQREGGRPVDAQQFCHGYDLAVGDQLGPKTHA
jgi:methionyl-tRNA formyltransferase